MIRAAGEPAAPAGRLFVGVDAAGLAVFRIAFGLLVAQRLFGSLGSGGVHSLYTEPAFHFTYYGFAWVASPVFGVEALFVATGTAAIALALGWWQRVAAGVFTFGFAWIFLLEKARYLNHYYLVLLIGGLFIFIPANSAYALTRRSTPTPRWGLMLLRAQIGLVYMHAGIAKLNADWLRAAPLRDWLPARADQSMFGPLLEMEVCAWVFSYGAIFMDLCAWPALAWKRTRLPAFALTSAFHITNASLFSIGIFPWTMIAATTLFFDPKWPRRFLSRIKRNTSSHVAVPSALGRRLVVSTLSFYLAFQLLYPLRHFLYPGRPSWNEEGHRFAWHMKLRDKEGEIRFLVLGKQPGERWLVDPQSELTDRQLRKMKGTPDMILEYAHHLAQRFGRDGTDQIQVFATSRVGLNGRQFAPFVDQTVDLARERRGFASYDWVLPLTVPLPD